MDLATKKIGRKTYSQSEYVNKVAKLVIKNNNIELEGARIKFLLVHPNISKRVAGRCIRNYEAAEAMTDYHYFIEFSGDIWDKISETAKQTLMLHELMHVYIKKKSDGTTNYCLLNHDVMDFREILEKHGFDWLYEIDKTRKEITELNKKNKTEKKEVTDTTETKQEGLIEHAS